MNIWFIFHLRWNGTPARPNDHGAASIVVPSKSQDPSNDVQFIDWVGRTYTHVATIVHPHPLYAVLYELYRIHLRVTACAAAKPDLPTRLAVPSPIDGYSSH